MTMIIIIIIKFAPDDNLTPGQRSYGAILFPGDNPYGASSNTPYVILFVTPFEKTARFSFASDKHRKSCR